MRFKRMTALSIIAVALVAFAARANGVSGAEFLRLENAANAALPLAGTAVIGGTETIVWNPAGIMGQDIAAISLTHFPSFVDTAFEQIEGLVVLDDDVRLAGRLFYASTYNLMEIDEFGDEIGSLQNYDIVGEVVYARKMINALSSAISINVFQSTLAGYQSQGFAFDAGVQYQLQSTIPINLGCAIHNIGVMSAYDQQADTLPLLLTTGIASDMEILEEHDLTAFADVQFALYDPYEIIPAAGLTYRYNDMAFLRMAYRFSEELGSFSFGAGLHWEMLGLDYAFQPYGELGDNHRLTLTYYFKPLQFDFKNNVIQKPIEKHLFTERQVKPLPQMNVPVLTLEQENYNAKITIKIKKEFKQALIVDSSGNTVKAFTKDHYPTGRIEWDGQNTSGQAIEKDETYQLIVQSGNQNNHQVDLPGVASALWTTIGDQSFSYFEMVKALNVENWKMEILENNGNSSIASVSGTAVVPNRSRVELGNYQDPTPLKAQLFLTINDSVDIILQETIKPISVQSLTAPSNYIGIAIDGILFDFDKALLKPEMADKVKLGVHILFHQLDKVFVVCEGHSDDIGSTEYNQKLSEKRALMIANYLIKNSGLQPSHTSIIGFGKGKPKNNEDSDEGRALNRRVQIQLYLPK